MRRPGARNVFFVVILCSFIAGSGCKFIGILGTPGAFEKKIPPQYDLQAQQNRKILLWVECPRSSNADYDVQEKLMAGFQVYLTGQAGIRPENIVMNRPDASIDYTQDPMTIARSMGIGYVLLVQVDDYELFRLNIRDYYSGRMLSHAVLMDADLGVTVWPEKTAAKVVEVDVDMETKGRSAALSRLVSATAHCTMRYLYPCEKLKFNVSEEKVSIQDAYEMETF